MNYFEQELRKIALACPGISNPAFAGRTCFCDLGGGNRAKLELVELGHADHYEALRATILNRAEGTVDSLLSRFKDIWGGEQAAPAPRESSGIKRRGAERARQTRAAVCRRFFIFWRGRGNMRFRYKYEHLSCACCLDLQTELCCPHEVCPHILDNLEDLLRDPEFLAAVALPDSCGTFHRPALLYLRNEGLTPCPA